MIDISRAIQYMEETQGLVLPYGLLPGSRPGGIDSIFDEERWAWYDWRALPAGIEGLELGDPSAKPSWEEIVSAFEYSTQADLRRDLTVELKEKVRNRINIAYGETNDRDEVFLRLSNSHSTAQDDERIRLLAVYRTQKESVSTMTLDDLQTYDPLADEIWDADDD